MDEPVAYMAENGLVNPFKTEQHTIPLYKQNKQEWKDLTTAEVKTLWNLTKKPTEFAAMLLAKFKEKNA